MLGLCAALGSADFFVLPPRRVVTHKLYVQKSKHSRAKELNILPTDGRAFGFAISPD